MRKSMPKIALGIWSWGAGAASGNQVFGNHLSEADWKPVFEKAMKCGLCIGTRFDASPAQAATTWAITKGTLPIIGATKVCQVEEAAKVTAIVLTEDEIKRPEKPGTKPAFLRFATGKKEM